MKSETEVSDEYVTIPFDSLILLISLMESIQVLLDEIVLVPLGQID